jgi:hypothetical protein
MARDEVDPKLVTVETNGNGFHAPKDVRRSIQRSRSSDGTVSGRDKLTMAEMKAQISNMWKHGDKYLDICEAVNDQFGLEGDERISVHDIKYHINTQINFWRQQGLLNIDEKQAMILARYDQLEMIATEAYFASCQGSRTYHFRKQEHRARSKEMDKTILKSILGKNRKIKEKGKKPKTHEAGDLMDNLILTQQKVDETSKMEERPAGDPRWLALMIEINNKRAQLWGLFSRAEQSSQEQEFARLPDEVRERRMAAILQQAQARRNKNIGLEALAPSSPLGGFKPEDVPKGPIVPEVLPPEDNHTWDDDEDEDDSWD